MSAPPEPLPSAAETVPDVSDARTEQLPVVRPTEALPGTPADPADGWPTGGTDADPVTGPIRIVPSPRPDRPAAPVALWAGAGVAGLIALGLLVDAGTAMSISDADAGQWYVVVDQMPTFLLAAAFGALAFVVGTARPTAPWLAGVLAACTLTAALDTVDGPGVLVCLGAIALAGALALSSTVRAALTAPSAPPPLLAARACAAWAACTSFVGVLMTVGVASYSYRTGPLVAAVVLFVLLAAACGWAVYALGRIVAAGRGCGLVDPVRIALVVLAGTGFVAALCAGAGAVGLLAVVPLLVSLVVAVLVPTGVRAYLGEAALGPVDRFDAAVAARAGVASAGRGGVEAAGQAAYAALPSSVRAASTTTKVIAGAFAAVALVVLVVLTSSDSNASAIGVLTIVVGLVAAAAVFTPTMPPIWRALCAGGALVSLYSGIDGSIGYSMRSGYAWLIGLLPLLLVGYVAMGFHTNRRNAVTSTAPGWVGERPRVAPPGPPLSFVPPVTAKGRSQIRLEVRTTLEPATVLAVVRRCTDVRGNWFVVGGDTVRAAGRSDDALGLVIGGGEGHAAFPARVHADGTGTRLTIGGMDRWTQRRSYYAGFIPAGPAHVQGYWMYTLYLQTVASELRGCDPRCTASIVT